MGEPFIVELAAGRWADAVRVYDPADVALALDSLELRRPSPVLVLVGGAGSLSEDDLVQLWPLFHDVLVPLAENLNVCVVDGGTDAGVMRLMGQARATHGASFPLIGVAAVGTVVLPGSRVAAFGEALEPSHSHFVLVPGSAWGDEGPWISRVASVLAHGSGSVTVLVSGGRISYEDAAASIQARRPVIAICGSGGTADALASALCADGCDERARAFVESGLLQAIDTSRDPGLLEDTIVRCLNQPDY